ncbi:uncharacterized protein LOC144873281 [Branchiostoma floridae x Branchiostoma japonicum]
MMKFPSPALVLLLCGLPHALGTSCKLLRPTNTDGTEVGLIIVPGAYIKGTAYQPLAQTIQDLSPHKLWVGLTDGYVTDLPNPLELSSAIQSCKQAMVQGGMKTDVFFIGAHSLGGTFLQMYLSDNPRQAKGMLLWGSYLTNSYPMATFPVPVLTLNGDLDGLVRLGYSWKKYREFVAIDANFSSPAVYQKPVVVVPGLNHGHIASGAMPSNVLNMDLPAEMTMEQAHRLIANSSVNFMVANSPNNTAFRQMEAVKQLRTQMNVTGRILAPFDIVSALDFDGKTSPWVTTAQESIIGAPAELQSKLTVKTEVMDNILDLGDHKPQVHKDGDMVTVQTYTKFDYPLNPIDNSEPYVSTNMLSTKMKRQSAVTKELGPGHYNSPITCKDLNQMAFQIASTAASTVAMARYQHKGHQLTFADDEMKSTGSGWLSGALTFEDQGDGTVKVTSPALVTNLDAWFGFDGMHYCKLLSPFRALEYIYTDSLRHVS